MVQASPSWAAGEDLSEICRVVHPHVPEETCGAGDSSTREGEATDMAFRLTPKDLDVLASIAEHRILGVHHVTVLHQRNAAAFRRRLRLMQNQGLIRIATRGNQRGLGRPERLVSLCERGVELLKANRLLDANIPTDRVTADRIGCLEHHLLINEFRIQLAQVNRIAPNLSERFLSSMSPKLYQSSANRPLIHERIPPPTDSDQWIEFTPDGVFVIRNTEDGKTVLFFLEADMGTETVASPQPFAPGVRQKVVNYKTYFLGKRYKHYEQTWNCRFRGFRLLFLTHNAGRLATLCRLIGEMQPSEFIWLTDQASLLSNGAWAPIWAPGGRINALPQSILGSQMPNPAPPRASLG